MEHPLSERTVFHIDVNSAFLSWTATRMLEEDPNAVDLRTIPSAVGGDIERRHGIILAKSIPAKKYGITTGEPVVKAVRKCPKLVLVRPDFHTYHRFSTAFVEVLRDYSPVVEQTSVDEAFVDMSGSAELYDSALGVAYEIKDRIRDKLGFTVNVGISCNKLLAKMASDFEKPDKVHTLYPEELEHKMWPLPIGDLYGVGRATRERLEMLGIKTIGDAARADEAYLRRIVGNAMGIYLLAAANGRDGSFVRTSFEAAKSYGNSVTLPEDITPLTKERLLCPTLLALSDSVGTRIRRDGAKASTVTVSLKTSEFVTRSKQHTLPKATDCTDEIYNAAVELFRELWDGVESVRLVGVSLSSISNEDFAQGSFFDEEAGSIRLEKKRRIDMTTDRIRERFGKPAVTRGSLLKNDSAKHIGDKDE